MCMRPSPRPLQILFCTALIQVQACSMWPSAYTNLHLQLWDRDWSYQETQLRVHTTQGQPRGIGVLMPQVINFWAIQGRNQCPRSPLSLLTHEMLLRWLLQGQVFQAEQSTAVSHGQFCNAAFLKTEYSCFTLCWFLLFSKVSQPYTYTYLLFFVFSHLDHHRAASRVLCAIQ